MEAALLDMMRQTVIIKTWSRDSTDGYGTPVYTGVPSTYRARVVAKPKRLIAPDGREIVATQVAWVASTAAIGLKDQCRVAGTTYPILAIERPTDEFGKVHHNKLYLGLA